MSDEERARWEHRYRTEGRWVIEPAQFVVDAVTELALDPGKALDVAGGTGRHALWLAARGWDVTLIDVAPSALALAAADAAAAGVALTTVVADLDDGALPEGPWDLIVVHHYLNRGLFPALRAALTPGGVLVFAQPTVENLTRHERPGPAHSLRLGEARDLVAGLEIVSWFEGWTPQGRHEAQVVARRA